ncbi:DCC1-like thiol-disulfide oxidoreductase family protein [Flavobacteriaceae bacterium]|jgi:predicted DCC family thiol-disulfide oxidoreductase YuxK|nr:DCC1-like thiol-disulfide oxidoreductase family protein [Flavobacteriaceae bacterium]MDA7727682.1 DCC1-like thiol-disulfide oxidoreductase family protein [Flavobacteriaceae bacterium]MDB0004052.1 DCC1-like thiol-disulfide oxidoreductase family protein [Flavobacteriaceae bacterium]
MQTSVFFDGVCNLCNRSVNFLISKDKKEVLKFASLQSEYAQNIIPKALLNRENLDTIIVYLDGKFYDRSNAVLKLCNILGGGFYVFLIGYLIPRFIRDGLYRFIANNRYRWFGKQSQCRVPSPELKDRFLD